MKLYKIRMKVMENITKGREKGKYKDIECREEIIVNNLTTAKNRYNSFLNQFHCATQYANTFGYCELFIPHIFEDGTIAYWPNDEKYILKEKK